MRGECDECNDIDVQDSFIVLWFLVWKDFKAFMSLKGIVYPLWPNTGEMLYTLIFSKL
jgi:hypothetical protein